MKKNILAVTLTAAAALVVSAPSVRADAVLTVISGSASTSVTAVDGAASVSVTSFNGWNVVIESALGFNSEGSASLPSMDVSTTDSGGASAGILDVIFSQQGYTFDGSVTAAISQTIDTHHGTTIAYTTYADGSDALSTTAPPAGTLLTSQLSTTGTPDPANQDATISLTGPYTLNQYLVISPTTKGVSSDASLDGIGVPDGGLTVALLGSLMLGFAGIRARFGGKRA